VVEEGFALGDFLTEEFDGALDFGGEPVELAEDGREKGDRFGDDVFDAEAHGFAVEEFHLEEAELHVDELMDERDLCRCDWVELFDEVSGDGEGVVMIGNEAIEFFSRSRGRV